MKKTSIGGQALIEGILMIGPKDSAVAVRKPDGEIIIDKKPLPPKSRFSKIPVIRGSFNLIRQMVMGLKALMYSAEFAELEDDEKEEKKEPSRLERFIEKKLGDRFQDAAIYFALAISLAFSIGLFILLPNLLAGLMSFNEDTFSGVVLLNLFEGLLRVTIFFGYLMIASMMKDIKRVWQYHGAEHKTIHCYESEEDLTIENAKKHTTKHPRCGTSFMFLVIVVSIVVFSFMGWYGIWLNILIRLLLIPIVAGISYEVVKLAGRSDGKIARVVSAPGLFFQMFTTKEPDDKQLEVAIEAFKNVMVEDDEAGKW